MKFTVVLCSVVGHKWRPAEATNEPGTRLKCLRCEREQLAPDGSAYENRVALKASRTASRTGRG